MDVDEDKRTIWCGNLSERVSEELLYELFLQAAPVDNVKIVKDREGRQQSYGFITLKYVNSVSYTMQLLNGMQLYNRKINVKARNKKCSQFQPILPKIDSPPSQSDFTLDDCQKLMQLGNKMMHFNDNYNEKAPGSYPRSNRNNQSYQEDKGPERNRGNNNGRFAPYKIKPYNLNYGRNRNRF